LRTLNLKISHLWFVNSVLNRNG